MALRIAGTAFVKVDGNLLALKGNLTVSPSPIERAMIAGQDYVHGFSEVPRVPYIEADFSTLPDVATEDIERIVDSVVTAELANGQMYVLRGAVCRAALEINTREGQFRARFEGLTCEEVMS